MSRAPSGKILKYTYKKVQKNGDIYVFERETRYDPGKKYNVVLHERLLYKIPKGEAEPVSTRPRRTPAAKRLNAAGKAGGPGMAVPDLDEVSASCRRTGALAILDIAGTESGTDEAVKLALDEGDALKCISLARYLVATDGHSLPAIVEWQMRHELPYKPGITEDIYHDLFTSLGDNETAHQKLFIALNHYSERQDGVFYDSTTISTYSEKNEDVRYGYYKDNDGLPIYKILTLYSLKQNRPIAFYLQLGNIPDNICISNALTKIDVIRLKKYMLVTDAGFITQENLTIYVKNNIDYLARISNHILWIKEVIDEVVSDLYDANCIIKTAYDNLDIHGITKTVWHNFEWTRKYNRGEKHKGDLEIMKRRVYVHVYLSETRHYKYSEKFKNTIFELKECIEAGIELTKMQEELRDKYFEVKSTRSGVVANIRNDEYNKAKKRKGIFVVISNHKKDTKEALEYYRRREKIEDSYKIEKDKTDGDKPRVWTMETYKGYAYVQFISICYYSWLYKKIQWMKETLGNKNGDPKHDLKSNIDKEKALLKWINSTSLYRILLHFDSYQTVQVRRGGKLKSWTGEMTALDRLFIEKLRAKTEEKAKTEEGAETEVGA